MSRKSGNKVNSSPEMGDRNQTTFPKHNEFAGNKKRVPGIWPKQKQFSPRKLWRRSLGAKVARALQFVSIASSIRRSSSPPANKVDSSANLMRSRSVVDPINESHRAEVIGDCIKFLNSSSSSSSVQRSKSVQGGS